MAALSLQKIKSVAVVKNEPILLRYTRDFTIAVVEAKAAYKLPGDGLQQAKEYAEILGLKFAYSTNGHGIVEFDYITGQERQVDSFPTPDELWTRLQAVQGFSNEKAAQRFLTPSYHLSGKSPRYYQEIAINRAVQAILQGQTRILLTMATDFIFCNDIVARWDFQRIIPCHFDSPVEADSYQFRQAFSFLEKKPSMSEYLFGIKSQPLPKEDFEFLRELEEKLIGSGIASPPKEKV